MNRRKLLSLATLSTVAWTITPLSAQIGVWKPLSATHNNLWKARSSKEVIKILYGDKKILKSDKIYIEAPKNAHNAEAIPINIKTDIKAKKIILLQDANHTSLIGIFEVPKDELVDYSFYIKLMMETSLFVLIEDYDGRVYKNSFKFELVVGRGW